MKIELDPGVESAIQATFPPADNRKPLLFNGRLDLMIEQFGTSLPRSEYTKGTLEELGYMTINSLLTERLITSDTSLGSLQAPEEQHRYHPKDIEIVNGVELNIDLAGVHRTNSFKDEDGGIHINLNIPEIFSIAYFISQNSGGELMSPALFRGLTYDDTAHELGHAIHYALSGSRCNAPRAWHNKALFIGYPMTMTCNDKREQTLREKLYRSISYERFAQFFEWEVVRGFGLSTNIRNDIIRTDALSIFGNGFTFSQMDHFVDGCQKRI
jgi:hypothetical protein